MIIFIIGIIVGGFFSWLFTYIYYQKSNKELKKSNKEFKKIIEKLPKVFIKELNKDKRKKISMKQLRDLLRRKLFDNKKDIFRYKKCPECGSHEIEIGKEFLDVDGDDPPSPIYVPAIFCKKCKWQDDAISRYSLEDFMSKKGTRKNK